MCRPCYMLNDTDATQEEIDQALEEDFPGYLASFKQGQSLCDQLELKFEGKGGEV